MFAFCAVNNTYSFTNEENQASTSIEIMATQSFQSVSVAGSTDGRSGAYQKVLRHTVGAAKLPVLASVQNW